ncbi:MAG: maleylpyruvate isomerase family mycothiol-dependent enzyme [Acidimicrobiia bacterium]|nr:maleylpyruvate isomerase family mycothiol-dependent enzyme [Acidimicrobiia bacterium]
MLNHAERIASARAAVDYITGRSVTEQQRPVPNCPGWTVYNAAAHIGRVSIAWEEMITSAPEDPESRERAYQRSAQQPAGAPMADLAAWAHSALDHLVDDVDRRCYFSMTGGEGTVGLWAWHAASELGVHRLDVEAALGHTHELTDDQALDAAAYTCQYFLPAMRRVTGKDPGEVSVRLLGSDDVDGSTTIGSESTRRVTVEGPSIQVLLALWGRPHTDIHVIDGAPEVWADWRALPGEAFQFGTWD